jgi:DNA polymerase I-like protein with 3'-5' exonuclease and polymerase domains
MSKIVLVFPSTVEVDPKTVFAEYMGDLDYDVLYLCSVEKEKILKKDIDLDLSVLEQYDIICPVGAEPLKYVCGLTGITKYNGHVIENKYVPLINPKLTVFKPQYKEDIHKACGKLKSLNVGNYVRPTIEKDYRHITDEYEYVKFLHELASVDYHVQDIETTALSKYRGNIIGVAFSTRAHQGVFVDGHLVKKHVTKLQDIRDASSYVIFHNAKFDIQWLEYEYGLKYDRRKIHDTMLLHYSLDEQVGTHRLKPLALKHTDLGDYERELDDYKKEFCRKNKILLEDFNYGMLPIEILAPYACKDADATFQLFNKFLPLVERTEPLKKTYYELLIPFSKALITLESNGGPVSRERLLETYERYADDIEDCLLDIQQDPDIARFERIYGKEFNPNSTKQLQDLLFTIKKLTPIKKTDSGAWSVDKEVLAELAAEDELTQAILDLREKTKLKGTYIENIIAGLDKDDRLRSSFNITGTTSGRLSSSGVLNYQNIPKGDSDIKKLFVARPGYVIVQADLTTAEVYVAAVLADDRFLQQAFVSKLDFHSYVAQQMFNIPIDVNMIKKDPKYSKFRQYAKAITFGIMYQAGPAKIAETVNNTPGIAIEDMITKDDAKNFINKYFSEAHKLKTYIDIANTQIERNAFIYSFFGRKRRLIESKSTQRSVASHAVRSGVNFLVQSVSSDINLLGLCDMIEWIEVNGYLNDIIPFTVVHDSIVSEVKIELVEMYATKLREFLQKDRGIMIPNCPIGVDVEVGSTWGDLEPLNEWLANSQ